MIRTALKVLLSVIIIPLLISLFTPLSLFQKSPTIYSIVLLVSIIFLVILENGSKKARKKMYLTESMPKNTTPLRGRDTELSIIDNLLNNGSNKQIVIVEGESGIGKTAITSAYISSCKKKYDLIIWQPLYDSPTPAQIINGWLNRFTTSIPDMSFDARLASFLNQLTENKFKRVVIVFDNMESILLNCRDGFELPDSYLTLIKRLLEYQGSIIHLLVTSAISIANLNDVSNKTINLNQLHNDYIKQIVYDRTKKDFDEKLLESAGGNPAAAILMAQSFNDFGDFYEGTFKSIVGKKLALMNEKQRKLLALFAIAKRPLTVIEIQEMWKALPPYSLIQARDITNLKNTFLLESITKDKYMVNAIVGKVISDSIIDDLIKAFSFEMLGQESYIRLIPLIYAKWSDKIKNEVKKQLFQTANDRLASETGKSISSGTNNRLSEILQYLLQNANDENDYLPSNVVSILLHFNINFNEVIFPPITLVGVDFSRTHLFKTNLSSATLKNCEFSDRIGSAFAVRFAGEENVLVGLQSGSVELRRVDTLSRIARAESHSEPVRALFFSKKYRKVLSGGEDGKVVIYDELLHIISTLQIHTRWVWQILELNENSVLSIGCDGQLGVVDLEKNLLKCRINVPSQRIWNGAILGNNLYITSEDGIIWKGDISGIQQGNISWEVALTVGDPIKACCICDNKVIFGCRNGKLYYILEEKERAELIAQQNGCIRSISSIPDEKIFITVGDTGIAVKYDIETCQPVSEFIVQSSRTWSIDILNDGKVATVGDDRTIHIWDTFEEISLRIIQGNGQSLKSADIIDDKMVLACADDFLRLKENDEVNPWITFRPKSRILGVVALNEGRWACSFDNGEIFIGGSSEKHILAHRGGIECIARNQTGTMFATGGEDRTINIFDSSGNKKKSPAPLHSSRIWSLSFSNNGDRLASAGGDFIIAIWDVNSSGIIASCVGHTNLVLSVCWVDNEKICSAGTDGSIRLWDSNNGGLIKMRNVSCVIRDLVVDGNYIYGVGRSVSKPSWALISWNYIDDILIEKDLNMQGGAAKTIICEADTLYVGGDRPSLLYIDKKTLEETRRINVPGVYSGMIISKSNCQNIDMDCLELLGAMVI